MIEQAEKYSLRSEKYWKQALEFFTKRDFLKATELAWGSVCEAIYALGYKKGQALKGHNDVKGFIRNLALSSGHEQLYELFKNAESAHANFYREFMDENEIRDVVAKVEELLRRIRQLLAEAG